MLVRVSLIVLCAVMAIMPAQAKEKQAAADAPVACSGAFAADSSEALLIKTYGADNVVTGDIDGPEGTTLVGTTVFPNDPNRKMEFVWFNEDARSQLSDVKLSSAQTAPGGVRIGMSVAEVEALNGAPYTVGGFDWDYGGYASFETGKLVSPLPGDCYLSVRFATMEEWPADVDADAISGEVEIPSGDAALKAVDARVQVVSLGYVLPE